MQKVQLIGNVGGEPEVREVGDNQVANFSIATTESYKNKQGEKITNTEWHNIVIWGGLAKVVQSYVKKGDKLYLEGKIKTETYEKDGEKKYTTKIICNQMEMLGGKPTGPSNESKAVSEVKKSAEDEDDLPF